MPVIKKMKIKIDPNSTPQEVGDMMSKGMHLVKDFEHAMHHNPFGCKLMSIGKPMMMGGLHNALDMMEPEVIHHMCHHHKHGHHGCKHMINNIIKGIILFLVWKIFESIDNRCCGMCESECIKKFEKDLSECYGKIGKVKSLLNESSLVLTNEHKIAMKVKGLEMLNNMFNENYGEEDNDKTSSLKGKLAIRNLSKDEKGKDSELSKTIQDALNKKQYKTYSVGLDSDSDIPHK